jgi:transcription elongation factor GreA
MAAADSKTVEDNELAAVAFYCRALREGVRAVSEEQKELSGKEKILAELKTLEYEFTVELPKALRTAAALGDLSENSEYKFARERQDYVRARVRQLQQQLAQLSSIDISRLPHDRASYGSTLVLRDLKRDEEVTYQLVTPEEADFEKGLISTASPIGKSLLNKEEGDEVKVQTPAGVREFEIVKLRTIHDEDGD